MGSVVTSAAAAADVRVAGSGILPSFTVQVRPGLFCSLLLVICVFFVHAAVVDIEGGGVVPGNVTERSLMRGC